MSRTIELVLGGARSGKSDWAVARAETMGGTVLFIATAEARDAEMQRRISEHRRARPASWRTLEEPLDVAARLRDETGSPEVVIVDCVTLLVSNRLLAGRLDGAGTEEIGAWAEDLSAQLRRCAACSIVVSNEVGSGLVPDSPVGRRFRDVLGAVNRALAARADTVRLLVAGLPITLKGE